MNSVTSHSEHVMRISALCKAAQVSWHAGDCVTFSTPAEFPSFCLRRGRLAWPCSRASREQSLLRV